MTDSLIDRSAFDETWALQGRFPKTVPELRAFVESYEHNRLRVGCEARQHFAATDTPLNDIVSGIAKAQREAVESGAQAEAFRNLPKSIFKAATDTPLDARAMDAATTAYDAAFPDAEGVTYDGMKAAIRAYITILGAPATHTSALKDSLTVVQRTIENAYSLTLDAVCKGGDKDAILDALSSAENALLAALNATKPAAQGDVHQTLDIIYTHACACITNEYNGYIETLRDIRDRAKAAMLTTRGNHHE